MMGLEPSTFCMARSGGRSHPFAPVRSNRLFTGSSPDGANAKRTRANAEPCHSCHDSFGVETSRRSGAQGISRFAQCWFALLFAMLSQPARRRLAWPTADCDEV